MLFAFGGRFMIVRITRFTPIIMATPRVKVMLIAFAQIAVAKTARNAEKN